MRFDKRCNEVVAVVVAFLHSHLNRVIGAAAGLLNQVRLELLIEKVIRCPLVNQDGPPFGRLTQQQTSVVVRPRLLVCAKIL